MGHRSRDSCRDLFKKLNIVPLQLQYILSLLPFMINNKDHYKVNSEIHSTNTRQISNLHQSSSNLVTYKKGYYFGNKVFNSLPPIPKTCLIIPNNLNEP